MVFFRINDYKNRYTISYFMKRILPRTLLILSLSLISFFSWSQACNTVPVQEAIINGDFENGDDGSFSVNGHTKFVPPGYSSPGMYHVSVGGTPNDFNAGAFDGVIDHTLADGTGLFLQIDATPTVNAEAWSQTVNVIPGQVYYFSAWRFDGY